MELDTQDPGSNPTIRSIFMNLGVDLGMEVLKVRTPHEVLMHQVMKVIKPEGTCHEHSEIFSRAGGQRTFVQTLRTRPNDPQRLMRQSDQSLRWNPGL